jgi:ATP-dependent helicase HrpB
VLRRALLAGFPDRVARRRRPKERDILLAGGGSARLSERSVVRDAEFLVAIEAEEREGGVEVRTASAIEPEWLLELGGDALHEVDEIRFDPGKDRIERVRAIRWLGVTIDESRSDAAGMPGGARVLAKAAMEAGLDRFVDRGALAQLQHRLALARRLDPSLPELDEARIASALERACEGRRSLSEIRHADLFEVLLAQFEPDVLARLDRLAPLHVALPGRKRVPVHYEADRPPWIASPIQDFFGLREGPRVLNEPLVLHLLAPNHRVVQVTIDLAGFWKRHYPLLRKELMRRYPRHDWPEDPTAPRRFR